MRPNPLLESKVRVVRPDEFTSPHVFRYEKPSAKRDLMRLFRRETAKQFVGRITPGLHIFGLSKGQFSLVDVLREVSDQIGPCDLSLSTWTDADLGELQDLVNSDRFTSVRFLLDFSFQRRQPGLINHIRQTFGNEAVVVTRNHCKFAMFSGGLWRIVCRTSMNLNFNPRLEDVELKDDPELYAFLDAILNELFKHHEPAKQIGKTSAELAAQFAGF